jgi:putative oxidoreductase
LLVPLSGVIAIVGGLSVVLGFHARWGAALLILFLIPVTLMMHPFWNIQDPAMAQMQEVSFMKNVSILGGTLFLVYFGAGPVSLDERRQLRATGTAHRGEMSRGT